MTDDNLLKALLVLYPSVPGPGYRERHWTEIDGLPVSSKPIVPGYHLDTFKDLLFWTVFGLIAAGYCWLIWLGLF